MNKVETAQRIFQSVLGNSTPNEVFNNKLVTISGDGKWLYECTGNGDVLSEAVLGVDFPREYGPIELDHYTTLATLKAIVASKQLHLHPVSKRLSEEEFTTFAGEHGLEGYFDENSFGEKVYKELSDDLFYLSLTTPENPNKADLWSGFAQDARGVRLRLRVTPKPPADLRRIGYQTGSRTALKCINKKLSAEEGLTYIPWKISRICAFYLPIGYGEEGEVRLLVKRQTDGPDLTFKSGKYEVWPISLVALGTKTVDPCCEMELAEVTAGPRCSKDAVQTALANSVFSSVPVTC